MSHTASSCQELIENRAVHGAGMAQEDSRRGQVPSSFYHVLPIIKFSYHSFISTFLSA